MKSESGFSLAMASQPFSKMALKRRLLSGTFGLPHTFYVFLLSHFFRHRTLKCVVVFLNKEIWNMQCAWKAKLFYVASSQCTALLDFAFNLWKQNCKQFLWQISLKWSFSDAQFQLLSSNWSWKPSNAGKQTSIFSRLKKYSNHQLENQTMQAIFPS